MDLSLTLENINPTSMLIKVGNQDTQRAIPDAIVSLNGPGIGAALAPSNCWQLGVDQLECAMGTMSPLQFSDLSFTFAAELPDSTHIIATVEGSGFLDVTTDNNSFKTDIHGNVTSYSGPVNDDPVNPITLSANGTGTSHNGTMASAEGGSTTPASLIALLMILVTRRLVTRRRLTL